jgi:hypothetical protein
MAWIRISITRGVRITFKNIYNKHRLHSFKRKIEGKTFVEAGSLDDQERYLALEMPSLRTAHADRKRENTHAKQHKDKA